jgi:NAD(P)-dependent dehydrogenase (short-subunit alcohol dehydrogenase family)
MTRIAIDMSGKVALVTGAGYGMGRASARRFASCGARVAIADIDEARGAETAELIAKEGGEALFIRADVSAPADVQDMIARVLAAYGRLDYAHNNAGIIEGQPAIHEYPDDQWHRIIANNLTSVFLCLKHEIPVMLGQGGGAIVNVASETAYKGNAGDAAYTASKHGVWGLTTVAALRYVRRGIRARRAVPPDRGTTPSCVSIVRVLNPSYYAPYGMLASCSMYWTRRIHRNPWKVTVPSWKVSCPRRMNREIPDSGFGLPRRTRPGPRR